MQITASHILVPTLEAATALHAQITGGADFAKLAGEHSSCPSGRNGGNLGPFGPGAMVKPFEDAAMATSIGQVSAPVKTQFGYHLIKRTA